MLYTVYIQCTVYVFLLNILILFYNYICDLRIDPQAKGDFCFGYAEKTGRRDVHMKSLTVCENAEGHLGTAFIYHGFVIPAMKA
jgi:hypothetical protein